MDIISLDKEYVAGTYGRYPVSLVSGKGRTDVWIAEEGRRKQSYKELITSNDREQLSGMVAALYRHRAALTAAGKKIHMSDENFLRDAEKILSGEIAAALNQTPSDALKYLRKNPCEAVVEARRKGHAVHASQCP